MKRIFACIMVLCAFSARAQKKPLDHTVYDSWQSIGTKVISNNGEWVAYTVTPQEGDATLIVYNTRTKKQQSFPRGNNPVISADNRYLAFAVKPFFAETRQAKIRKKKTADMPKDSLYVLQLGNASIWKSASVRSFKIAEEGSVVAYLQEKPKYDSTSGTLSIFYPEKNITDTIANVQEYTFSKPGNKLLVDTREALLLWDVQQHHADTVSKGVALRKQFMFDEKGEQAAWCSSRDSIKALKQLYDLYYYNGKDTGTIVPLENTPAGWTVSPDGKLSFSKNGQRLFFGTAPAPVEKDTNIVEFEVAKVDIWNYKDDFLQPMQLKNADKELKRSYLAVYYPSSHKVLQLADKEMETVVVPEEGNYAIGHTDKNERVAMQWTGHTLKTAYLVNLVDGTRKLIKEQLDSFALISPAGKYVVWYDMQQKNWFAYETATGTTRNISSGIPYPLYDELDDHPDAPEAYGLAGWGKDELPYVYDRYDIWKGAEAITKGRKDKIRYRYVKLDKEEQYVAKDMVLLAFNEVTKENGIYAKKLSMGPYAYTDLLKAKKANVLVYLKGSYVASPDVYVGETQISHLNPQQTAYNWGTASLFKWTAYNGKPTEGIVYKPEDFDSTKKYPVLIYFYEKLTEDLYKYIPPAPTPSRLNISFFVSRGYIVLAPDITYETGHPGKSAYDYIVSGARALAQNSWVDSTRMGIQGQSWGGYQVAYLVTQTDLFRAAWAGAPVANMTSAYGGIRWESGMNRQFQYERSQSRIGATLWEKPELYIENSPLFHLTNVHTPLAIMSNDADGAVPWYQGIELFTGLRRLGKPVWMLNYNNEAHNLVLRQNRKDIQRREQQFFDYFLKDAPAPEWILSGVPATQKGRNWGWKE
jgi:dipeptidyl aminopeptidase/acylaminoacyl peptidase